MRSILRPSCVLGGILFLGCATDDGVPVQTTGSTESPGGASARTSASKPGQSNATGGRTSRPEGSTTKSMGGRAAQGGNASLATGGTSTTKGDSKAPSGGSVAAGGSSTKAQDRTWPSRGGSATGGSSDERPTGGRASDGTTMTGGKAAGGDATGGSKTTVATTTTTAPVPTTLDCSAVPAMPTSGGTDHCGSYRTGKAAGLSWELWTNNYSGNACITYYSTPAFGARWNNNGDYLARLGLEWGGKSIASLGEVTAEFAYKKTGTGGGYSYIGVYGWATTPCVEYYIIDDSFNGMPFNPWNMQGKGSATIDGEVYKFYAGNTNGTGGSRCAGGGSFTQYWSVRQKGRQCGIMTISKHFEEWKKVGMNMDNILEAKILVETGGGQGSVEFPVANMKASN